MFVKLFTICSDVPYKKLTDVAREDRVGVGVEKKYSKNEQEQRAEKEKEKERTNVEYIKSFKV